MPELYVVLGLRGSGRLAVVADLIAGGIEETQDVAVYVSTDDVAAENESVVKVEAVARLGNYHRLDELTNAELSADVIFLLADGASDPVDFMETLVSWCQRQDVTPARILTVLHCQLAFKHARELETWHEACVHFSDAVLLNQRESVDERWLRHYVDGFQKARYPCLFEFVKQGRVNNPAVILEPQARRLSLIFDDIDAIDLLEIDENDLPEAPIDLDRPADPYFERLPTGQRARRLPDISSIVG